MKKHNLKITVIEIQGKCPVYKVGNSFRIEEGYKLITNFPICLHSLSSIMPYYVALSNGVPPEDLGLGKGKFAYVQCLDPCKYTGGGTVIYKIGIE